MEIRRSYDRLISTVGFPILVRRHLYIEPGPCCIFVMGGLIDLEWKGSNMNIWIDKWVILGTGVFSARRCSSCLSYDNSWFSVWGHLGAVSILRCHLISIGIPMLKIRRSCDLLIRTFSNWVDICLVVRPKLNDFSRSKLYRGKVTRCKECVTLDLLFFSVLTLTFENA